MRYPIGILGISIFILYQLGITMKIKVSKLREVLKKRGLNENFITNFFSKLAGDKTKKEKLRKKYEKELIDVNDEIENFINSQEESERDGYRKLVNAFNKAHNL